AEEGAVARHARAPARSVRIRLEDGAADASPPELRMAPADLLLAHAGEREQRRREVEVRAHGTRALPLPAPGDAYREIDDGRLVEVDGALLRHTVCAIHLAVVTGEHHHRVLPPIQLVERIQHTAQRRVHDAARG